MLFVVLKEEGVPVGVHPLCRKNYELKGETYSKTLIRMFRYHTVSP